MKKTVFACLLLVTLMLTSCQETAMPPAVTTVPVGNQTSASAEETMGLNYEAVSDTTCRVVSYIGRDKNPVIPAKDANDRLVVAIGAGTFEGNDFVTSVKLPLSVKTIEASAFRACSALVSVDMPAHLEAIEDNAFADCYALTSVALPAGVTTIGKDAFAGCSSLSRITVDEDNPALASDGQLLTSKDGSHLYVAAPAGGLSEFVSSDNLKSISAYAFSGHKTLSRAVLGDNVTHVGAYAFSDCAALTAFSVGTGLKALPDGCFRRSKALTDVSLPDDLISIGTSAFDGCSALADIAVPDTVTAVGMRAFASTPWLKAQDDEFVTVGRGVLIAWRGEGDHVRVPDGITALSDAFHGADVESVVLPESLVNIGENAFRSCGKLERVTLPASLASVGKSAFYGCIALAGVEGLDNLAAVIVADGNEALTRLF